MALVAIHVVFFDVNFSPKRRQKVSNSSALQDSRYYYSQEKLSLLLITVEFVVIFFHSMLFPWPSVFVGVTVDFEFIIALVVVLHMSFVRDCW